MLVDNVKTYYPEPRVTMREDKRRDWSEIGVYVDNPNGRALAAVITHPCAGAKWFVYPGQKTDRDRVACRTRKAAIDAAMQIARDALAAAAN